MTTDLILGTAGHIDHGKTSLIRALTGTDTDRLPEEKKRGITIELGFAELHLGEFRLGIVDVPGHERFVRNMLAGATGMDIAMLVVAADDSVKQQTIEHMEILRLLNRSAGVIAITKCDLVEPDWLTLVEDEVRELVRGTFLEDAPVVRTSATTHQGLDELKRALGAAAARAVAARGGTATASAPFRLAIDRVFTVAGHGTVVTGSVASGQTRIGDELRVEPGSIAVRVRGLQNHDRAATESIRGQRAAINLAGIHHTEIRRGHELASPNHLVPSRIVTVWLQLLNSAKPLKDRSRYRFHAGTAEIMSNVRLLDREQLDPGQFAPAQIYLSEPAVTIWNQPFVLRSESPVATVGGGQVLQPNPQRVRKVAPQWLEFLRQLREADPVLRSEAALFLAGIGDWDPAELPRTAGIEDHQAVYQQLCERQQVTEIPISPTRRVRVHPATLAAYADRIEAFLKKQHQREPLRLDIPLDTVLHHFVYVGDKAIVLAIVQEMKAAGRIVGTARGVALKGHGPKLSQNERKLLAQLVEQYRQFGIEPPTAKEIQKQTTKNQASVPQLLELAVANGDLVRVAPESFLHAQVDIEMKQRLRDAFQTHSGLVVSQIREILGTSRKYAVPYCEYLDATGFTQRQGDQRVLANSFTDDGLN